MSNVGRVSCVCPIMGEGRSQRGRPSLSDVPGCSKAPLIALLALTSAHKVTIAYDTNGNTLTKTEPSGTTTYTWDYENRLTSVTLPNGKVHSFTYDSFGRRIRG